MNPVALCVQRKILHPKAKGGFLALQIYRFSFGRQILWVLVLVAMQSSPHLYWRIIEN